MAFSSPAGSSVRGGWGYKPVTTVPLLADKREQLSLQEGFAQGVGKAHRQIVYAHQEFRNYGCTSRIPRPYILK